MIVQRDYTTILANLSRDKPVNLDKTVFDAPQATGTFEPGLAAFPVSGVLWKTREEGHSFIGLRIKSPIEAPEKLAARLCSIALERQVHPVFLNYISQNVMQQYGFRVEQLSGLSDNAQQQFQQQLQCFWQLALIIDVSETENLG